MLPSGEEHLRLAQTERLLLESEGMALEGSPEDDESSFIPIPTPLRGNVTDTFCVRKSRLRELQ